MAYEKQTWQCGDIVTAEKLNNIEDGIEEALACCGGGSGDAGYSCSDGTRVLTDETITTAEPFPNAGFAIAPLGDDVELGADELIITFDGTEYTCPKVTLEDAGYLYGAPADLSQGYLFDFSEYPFSVSSSSDGKLLATPTAGTYTLKIEGGAVVAETTECFRRAVGSASKAVKRVSFRQATSEECRQGGAVDIYDSTWEELKEAFLMGLPIYLDSRERAGQLYRAYLVGLYINEGVYTATFALQEGTSVYTIVLTASAPDEPLVRLACIEK